MKWLDLSRYHLELLLVIPDKDPDKGFLACVGDTAKSAHLLGRAGLSPSLTNANLWTGSLDLSIDQIQRVMLLSRPIDVSPQSVILRLDDPFQANEAESEAAHDYATQEQDDSLPEELLQTPGHQRPVLEPEHYPAANSAESHGRSAGEDHEGRRQGDIISDSRREGDEHNEAIRGSTVSLGTAETSVAAGPRPEEVLAGTDTYRGSEHSYPGTPSLSEPTPSEPIGLARAINHFQFEGWIPDSQDERLGANVKAIETLHQLGLEKRLPTAEEQQALSRYTGWGGFKSETLNWWDVRAGEDRSPLARLEEENMINHRVVDQLALSVNTAFYTPPEVVKAIWQSAENLGFKGGNVLELGAGIGSFLGYAPTRIVDNSRFAAIEREPIAASILGHLFPSAELQAVDLQSAIIPNKYFDLAIGNIPYGDTKMTTDNGRKLSVHNYFIEKAFEALKPNGILAVITSTHTLDSRANEDLRQLWEQRAEFLGAVRLPAGTFQQNANTEAPGDIIVYRKFRLGENASELPTLSAVNADCHDITLDNGHEYSANCNNYFIKHPEQIVGTLSLATNRWGDRDVGGELPDNQEDYSEQLKNALSRIRNEHADSAFSIIPQDLLIDGTSEAKSGRQFIISSEGLSHLSKDSFVYGQGILGQVDTIVRDIDDNEKIVAIELDQSKYRGSDLLLIRSYIDVRDALDSLIDKQIAIQNDHDVALIAARTLLNEMYDKHRQMFGAFDELSRKATKVLDMDPSFRYVLGLEQRDEVTNEVTKTSLFTQRTALAYREITSVDSASEGLLASLAYKGNINPEYISKIYNRPWEEIREELGNSIFKDPLTRQWQRQDQYLSGNVVEKLDHALAAINFDKEYQRNVEALTASQPVPCVPNEISINLGAPWHGMDLARQFISDKLGFPEYADRIRIDELVDGSKRVDISNLPTRRNSNNRNAEEENRTQGASGKPFTELVSHILSSHTPKYTKMEEGDYQALLAKIKVIGESFGTWAWAEEERKQEVLLRYNTRVNVFVAPNIDGNHLVFPGMTPKIQLRKEQKDAVWAAFLNGNIALAHEVGCGKTFTQIATAMTFKNFGEASKPLLVVRNNTLNQIADAATLLYPGARIFTCNKENMAPESRERTLAKIAMGNWDLVIMPHSSFSRLPLSPSIEAKQIREEIATYREFINDSTDQSSRAFKNAQKKLDSLQSELTALLNNPRKGICFDQLGIDFISIDEAHNFKNLAFRTRMTDIYGLGNGDSKRAADLHRKIQHLYDLRGSESGVVYATGTPISNTLAEVYTLYKYLAPSMLKKAGIREFDDFTKTFFQPKTEPEITVGGEYKNITRLEGRNIPELVKANLNFMNIRTADQMGIPRPLCNTHIVTVEKSEVHLAFDMEIRQRLEDIRTQRARDSAGNPTDFIGAILMECRKAAVDLRLVDPRVPDLPSSKINACIDNLTKVYLADDSQKKTQLVFLDLGVPGGVLFDLYADMKKKLVANGISEDLIAFVHDAKTDDHKAELFEKFRLGETRILIGCTEKMGEGTNFQDHLVALHDVDCPWKPATLEQRLGRMVRFGNTNPEVDHFVYTTQDTFDLFMYQLNREKASVIKRIMTCDLNTRTFDESAQLGFAEIMAVTSGSEILKEKVAADAKLVQLKAEYTNWERFQYEERIAINRMTNSAAVLRSQIEDIDKVLPHILPSDSKSNWAWEDKILAYSTIQDRVRGTMKGMMDEVSKLSPNSKALDIPIALSFRGVPIEMSVYRSTGDKVGYEFGIAKFDSKINFGDLPSIGRWLDSAEEVRPVLLKKANEHESNAALKKTNLEPVFPKLEEIKSLELRVRDLHQEVEKELDRLNAQRANAPYSSINEWLMLNGHASPRVQQSTQRLATA